MKKQGHNNNIDKKNQSKFPNTKANNKNIVKIPLKPLSKSCVEIGKYDINDTTHIFMQKTKEIVKVVLINKGLCDIVKVAKTRLIFIYVFSVLAQ